jgi:hypothetical protein
MSYVHCPAALPLKAGYSNQLNYRTVIVNNKRTISYVHRPAALPLKAGYSNQLNYRTVLSIT